MPIDDLIKLILAICGVLTLLGGGIVGIGRGVKWLVVTFVAAQTANTKAITDASAAQTSAINALRLELRELRVEVRTLYRMQPPPDTEPSEDGEPVPLPPMRSIPRNGSKS